MRWDYTLFQCKLEEMADQYSVIPFSVLSDFAEYSNLLQMSAVAVLFA